MLTFNTNHLFVYGANNVVVNEENPQTKDNIITILSVLGVATLVMIILGSNFARKIKENN